MAPLRPLVAFAVLLGISCTSQVSSELTRVGPQRAALGDDCTVKQFENTLPDYDFVDLARIEVRCSEQAMTGPEGREVCMARLIKDACEAGADTAYTITVSAGGGGKMVVRAFLAARVTRSADGESGERVCRPPCSPGHECDRGRCEPICEPACEEGFICMGGECKPMCNPPCVEGMECTEDRTCQPIPEPEVPDAGMDAADAEPEPAPRRRRGKNRGKNRNKKRR